MWIRSAAVAAGVAVLAGVAGTVAAGQLNVVAGAAVAQRASVTLAPQAAGELAVRVPLPPGWNHVPIPAPATRDYPVDRLLMASPGQRENGYAPTVIVSVDRLGARSPQEYARWLSGQISRNSATVEQSSTLVCGRPAFRLDFTGLGSPTGDGRTQSGMALTVVPDGGTYAYTAILQTRNVDSVGYRIQRDALLESFCLGEGA